MHDWDYAIQYHLKKKLQVIINLMHLFLEMWMIAKK